MAQACTKANTPPHNAILVWDIFSQMYGAGFVTQFGEKPPRIWIEELGQISACDIENGLMQCKRTASNFAPSLPQFLAYCGDGLTKEQRAFQARCKAGNEMKALPKPDADPEIRRTAISEIKKLLRGGI